MASRFGRPLRPFAKEDIVRYHPVIGQPHDGKEYEIVDFGSINGERDVCWLLGKRGCVSTKAISHARCPGCGKSYPDECDWCSEDFRPTDLPRGDENQ